MDFKRCGNVIAVRLDKGDEIIESLKKIANAERILTGAVSGIGATDDFSAGVFNSQTRKFDETSHKGPHEICSLLGNITAKDGEPYIHLHICCADLTGKLFGGHLVRAAISVTGEIFISDIQTEIRRKFDENAGINVFEL